VADGPEVPGEWDPSGSGEPPAALLRRAISHVESLLHRLDPVDAMNPPAGDLDLPPVVVPPPAVDEPKSSTAQADALRISLRAHEEAHRLRAEANGARAEAAAEGERILIEARELGERIRADARDTVAEMVGIARGEAAVVIEAARAEAERIRQAALADDDHRRAEFEAHAEHDRVLAADAVRALLDEATHDADRILEQARQRGRAEAAKVIDIEVGAAVAEARESVQASRQRALELLTGAHSSIEEVRATMRRLIDALGESLTSLDASAGSIDALLGSVLDYADPSGPEAAPADSEADAERFTAEQRHVADRWADRERRPLGLLFGTQGG
jgi:hypothetical protein